MGTLTDNFQFQLPDDQGDFNTWGAAFDPADDPATDPSPGYNGNWEKLDLILKDMEDRVAYIEANGTGSYMVYEAIDQTEYRIDYQAYLVIGDVFYQWGYTESQGSPTDDPYTHTYRGTYAETPANHMVSTDMANAFFVLVDETQDRLSGVTYWAALDHGTTLDDWHSIMTIGTWDEGTIT